MGKKKLIGGNEAIAEGCIVAGVQVFAGYPITPSSEVQAMLSKRLPATGGRFIQMEDEIASMGVIIGASSAGKKAMTATSGPGFSLMQELMGYAAMVELPIVVYNAQRVGPSTGAATKPQQGDIMQCKYGSHGDSPRITLYPGDVREMFDLTVKSFNLAEKYMQPVVLLSDQILSQMRESTELPDFDTVEVINRRSDAPPQEDYLPYKIDDFGIPVLPPLGGGYNYGIAGMTHSEEGFPNTAPEVIDECIRRINTKLDKHYDDIVIFEHIKNERAKIALITFGCVTKPGRGTIHKAAELGIDVEYFRPITMWPFPERELREIAERVDTIVVAEMNLGQVAGLVRQAIEGRAEVIQMNKVNAEAITVQDILPVIQECNTRSGNGKLKNYSAVSR